MLKIERTSNGTRVVFTLSGRIEKQEVAELHRLFESEPLYHHIRLDLKNIMLVDAEAVKFLSGCEAEGMVLEDCPAYVRKWIDGVTADNT